MFRRTLTVIACLVAVPTAALAADLVGDPGLVRELEVNTTSSDTYLNRHGRVVIANKGSSAEYRWGGVSCGSRTLTDAQVAVLQRALDGAMKVQPLYQPGLGSASCLVGMTITP
jgi:hypothetical protein